MLFQLAFLGVEVMMIGNSTSKLIVPKLISKSEDMWKQPKKSACMGKLFSFVSVETKMDSLKSRSVYLGPKIEWHKVISHEGHSWTFNLMCSGS